MGRDDLGEQVDPGTIDRACDQCIVFFLLGSTRAIPFGKSVWMRSLFTFCNWPPLQTLRLMTLLNRSGHPFQPAVHFVQ